MGSRCVPRSVSLASLSSEKKRSGQAGLLVPQATTTARAPVKRENDISPREVEVFLLRSPLQYELALDQLLPPRLVTPW